MANNSTIYKLIKIFLILIAAMTVLVAASITAKAEFTLSTSNAIAHSDTQINLSWTSVADSVYYKVSRNNVLVASIDIDTERNFLSYIDTDLSPQTSYNYAIAAVDSDGNVIKTVNGSAITTQMEAPSIASSFVDLNKKSVTLTWVNNSQAVSSTSVIKLGEGMISTLSNDGTSITFIDSSLNANTTVQYEIMSSDGKGHFSPRSTSVTIKPVEIPYIKAALDNRISTISWDSNSNISYFELQRSKYQENSWGSWETIAEEIKSNSTSITDTLAGDGTFRYRLSLDTKTFTGYSNISNPVTSLFLLQIYSAYLSV